VVRLSGSAVDLDGDRLQVADSSLMRSGLQAAGSTLMRGSRRWTRRSCVVGPRRWVGARAWRVPGGLGAQRLMEDSAFGTRRSSFDDASYSEGLARMTAAWVGACGLGGVELGAGGVKNMEALMSVLIVVGWAGAALQQWRGRIGVGD
jgi:hypothetical protein